MEIGDMLPAGELIAADGTRFALSDRIGRPTVVYFYPKADTTGCTREAQDFSALVSEFRARGAYVLGISRDTPAKLKRFADKHGLTIELAGDEGGAVCEAFGTWVEKQMYGRSYMGIERATFLFDAQGKLVRQWRKVKVAGHATEVLASMPA